MSTAAIFLSRSALESSSHPWLDGWRAFQAQIRALGEHPVGQQVARRVRRWIRLLWTILLGLGHSQAFAQFGGGVVRLPRRQGPGAQGSAIAGLWGRGDEESAFGFDQDSVDSRVSRTERGPGGNRGLLVHVVWVRPGQRRKRATRVGQLNPTARIRAARMAAKAMVGPLPSWAGAADA